MPSLVSFLAELSAPSKRATGTAAVAAPASARKRRRDNSNEFIFLNDDDVRAAPLARTLPFPPVWVRPQRRQVVLPRSRVQVRRVRSSNLAVLPDFHVPSSANALSRPAIHSCFFASRCSEAA